MKTILILSFSNLKSDPRVYKQIVTLSKTNKIISVGLQSAEVPGAEFIQLNEKYLQNKEKVRLLYYLKTMQFDKAYWALPVIKSALAQLTKLPHVDLILANDIISLPLALSLKARQPSAKVILDAHEYSPKEYDNNFKWKFLWQNFYHNICKNYLQKVDNFITVAPQIALEYKRNYHVDAEIIYNVPYYQNLKPTSSNPEKIKIIHHGGINPSRQIEEMIYLADHLDSRFSIDFMLVPGGHIDYYNRLKALIEQRKNTRLLPPVPMQELAQYNNQYDIGLYILPDNSFNNKNALPNKFFEFVQSRLMLVTGPSTEMQTLIKKYDLGIANPNYDLKSLAQQLNQLTPQQIEFYKNQSDRAARELCYEKFEETLINTVT